jgi:aspartate 1-decarboxylase
VHIQMLKSKIHRAVVTGAEVDYVGSITVDPELFEAAGMVEYEKVQIADVETGSRLETYIIAGEPGKGEICLNGAAAKLVNVGDHVIIMSYASLTPEEAKTQKPLVVFVNEKNQLTRLTHYEKSGRLYDQEAEK